MSDRKVKFTPTVLSAFTGLGGLDLGLELAGFKPVVCIENNSFARQSLGLNRSEWKLRGTGDITQLAQTLRPSAVGLKSRELGILAGGPPCAPFSKAAQWSSKGRAGWRDRRAGTCIRAFMRLVKSFLPAVVLIENVPGFIKGRSAATRNIQLALRKINRIHKTKYRLEWRVVNAVEFGVAQRRERAILVAFREGNKFIWPSPTHSEQPVRAWDALSNVTPELTPKPMGRWTELLPSIPEGHNYLWHTDAGGGRPLFGYRTRYWSFLLKLAKAAPAWTVPAQPGPATGPFHWENRPLAIEELLRLQSFPATWKVCGPRREQVRQIGNATPPLLAEVIGRALGEQVFGLSYRGRPKLSISRRRTVPPARRSLPLPKSFARFEGEHSAHLGTGKGPSPVATA